jgi:excisionase family DNA binding protein
METAHEELLTAAELARRLAVKPSTILEWQRSGRIPSLRLSHKVRRFILSEVIAALRHRSSAEVAT